MQQKNHAKNWFAINLLIVLCVVFILRRMSARKTPGRANSHKHASITYKHKNITNLIEAKILTRKGIEIKDPFCFEPPPPPPPALPQCFLRPQLHLMFFYTTQFCVKNSTFAWGA